jgi:hypothetical protein
LRPGCTATPRTIRDADFGPRITTRRQKVGQSITANRNAFGAKEGPGWDSAAGAKATAAQPRTDRDCGCTNRVWAVDFQVDVTTARRPIEIASIVDKCSRECSGGTVKRGVTGEHLIGERSRLAIERASLPAVPRCDKGFELVCRRLFNRLRAAWASPSAGRRTSRCTRCRGVQHRLQGRRCPTSEYR